ncbi:MAG: topoisomerase C-terminal repeat-containing protein, partial [Pirellulales bacterium]
GLKQLLAEKVAEIDARDVGRILIGKPEGAEPIYVRVGRYGPFVEQGDRRGSLREDLAPDEITVEAALEILSHAAASEEPLGHCPDTLKPVYLKVGRFGPYVQRGNPEDEEKPKNASLLKGMQREDVTLETALQLLSLPRELGAHPESGLAVVAYNGRFGPYVKCGEETRSLPAGLSPIEVTLAQALELLAQPKAMRRGFGAPKEPLKVFDESPITKQKVQLLDGRYGPYLTDGTTNASLPKGLSPDGLTQEQALEFLAARAALGPSKKSSRRKSARPKPAAKAAAKKGPALAENGHGESPLKKGVKKKTPARRKTAAKRD